MVRETRRMLLTAQPPAGRTRDLVYFPFSSFLSFLPECRGSTSRALQKMGQADALNPNALRRRARRTECVNKYAGKLDFLVFSLSLFPPFFSKPWRICRQLAGGVPGRGSASGRCQPGGRGPGLLPSPALAPRQGRNRNRLRPRRGPVRPPGRRPFRRRRTFVPR
jgi:hypothetical protein